MPKGLVWPRELNRLSDDLGTRLGQPDPPAPVAAPELERLRVFEAILRLVEWASADRPLLIAVDDAHRADRASLRLTAHIARRIATLPVLLVLTRRDHPARTELDALIADLASRQVPIAEVGLRPIPDADIAALATSVASQLASDGLSDDSIRRVVSAADGNPLFAVESARALAAGQTAVPRLFSAPAWWWPPQVASATATPCCVRPCTPRSQIQRRCMIGLRKQWIAATTLA